jgi:HPt (histidine-containing phosphotransfer) domain-containing protein
MNGYETAKAIRNLENGKNIPIIALTAGTLLGERERCLEAGMNEYMTKPLVQQNLTEMITKWLLPEILAEKKGILEEILSDFDRKHFDKNHLLSLFDGDKMICNELMKLAQTTFSESRDKLLAAIQNKDKQSILNISHRLKGSAATAGFFILLPLTDQMETLDKKKEEELYKLAGKIKEELDYLLDNFQGLLE